MVISPITHHDAIKIESGQISCAESEYIKVEVKNNPGHEGVLR